MAACQRMVAELIDHIEVYHAEKQDGITNGSPEDPGGRHYHGNKKRRSTQLRPRNALQYELCGK